MKLGIIIYSNEPESVWNAFRLGTFSQNKKDTVRVFLLGNGVEAESLDTERFTITREMRTFIESGGEILACGTCLKIRESEGTEICPLSTMEELYKIIEQSDKVLTF